MKVSRSQWTGPRSLATSYPTPPTHSTSSPFRLTSWYPMKPCCSGSKSGSSHSAAAELHPPCRNESISHRLKSSGRLNVTFKYRNSASTQHANATMCAQQDSTWSRHQPFHPLYARKDRLPYQACSFHCVQLSFCVFPPRMFQSSLALQGC